MGSLRQELYRQRKALAEENRRYPERLIKIPEAEWRAKAGHALAMGMTAPIEVWRSRGFLVQIFAACAPAVERLTIQTTTPERDGWKAGISWEELQELKAQCGRGDRYAVEIFPACADVVNVANMRHLWILAEAPAFAWRNQSAAAKEVDDG